RRHHFSRRAAFAKNKWKRSRWNLSQQIQNKIPRARIKSKRNNHQEFGQSNSKHPSCKLDQLPNPAMPGKWKNLFCTCCWQRILLLCTCHLTFIFVKISLFITYWIALHTYTHCSFLELASGMLKKQVQKSLQFVLRQTFSFT